MAPKETRLPGRVKLGHVRAPKEMCSSGSGQLGSCRVRVLEETHSAGSGRVRSCGRTQGNTFERPRSV